MNAEERLVKCGRPRSRSLSPRSVRNLKNLPRKEVDGCWDELSGGDGGMEGHKILKDELDRYVADKVDQWKGAGAFPAPIRCN